jgi:hypothetical protein
MAKFRIFTDCLPDINSTAGKVLEGIMFELAATHDLEFYILLEGNIQDLETSSIFKSSKFHFLQSPISSWKLGFLTKPYSKFMRRHFDSDLRSIIKYIDRENSRDLPDHQIFVLQSSTSILLCDHFKDITESYSTITWDPWSWWSRNHKVPSGLDSQVSDALEKIYMIGFHLVPNQMWKEEFAQSLGEFYEIYLPFQQNGKEITSENPQVINLCFAGNPYAKHEFESFIDFMISKNWKLDGKRVLLHFYGSFCPFESKYVINHGNISPKSLIATLARHDVAILPYPSGNLNRDVSKFSFPSKYLTYLAAGLPTILIGNRDSTICHFVDQTGFSIQPDQISDSFEVNFSRLNEEGHYVSERIDTMRSQKFSSVVFSSTISAWMLDSGFPLVAKISSSPTTTVSVNDLVLTRDSFEVKSVKLSLRVHRVARFSKMILNILRPWKKGRSIFYLGKKAIRIFLRWKTGHNLINFVTKLLIRLSQFR